MSATAASASAADQLATGPADLTAAIAAIEGKSKYESSDWGYIAIDQESGEVLASQNPDKMFDPGSTMKSYTVSAALEAYGGDHTFTTPVYKVGTVSGGTLDGNLVLVGAGDLSFGLRAEPDGSLYYENLPVIDHSYATLGQPGAVEPPGDPLGVLNQFAQQVKAAGITAVNGDVVVDDRLFTPIEWPDGLVSPIWINENLIDIEVSPGSASGQATTVDWRPQIASYTVETQATTVDANGSTDLQVTEPTPGRIVVTGTIAAGEAPRLVVQEITDPSTFARTAFIEALQRAGVTVTAAPTGPNPTSLLPAAGSYQDADKLAEHTSASLAAYIELIMKVSSPWCGPDGLPRSGQGRQHRRRPGHRRRGRHLHRTRRRQDRRVPLRRRRLQRSEPFHTSCHGDLLPERAAGAVCPGVHRRTSDPGQGRHPR